eukprot:1206696-Pleurochrysis_carterae.AAC.6
MPWGYAADYNRRASCTKLYGRKAAQCAVLVRRRPLHRVADQETECNINGNCSQPKQRGQMTPVSKKNCPLRVAVGPAMKSLESGVQKPLKSVVSPCFQPACHAVWPWYVRHHPPSPEQRLLSGMLYSVIDWKRIRVKEPFARPNRTHKRTQIASLYKP